MMIYGFLILGFFVGFGAGMFFAAVSIHRGWSPYYTRR